MSGMLLVMLAMFIGVGGIAKLLIGIVSGVASPRRARGSLRWPILVTLSAIGVYPLHNAGQSMLLADQDEAKSSIDSQLTNFNGKPPAIASQFFAGRQVHRLLRHRFNYRSDGNGDYETGFTWDFDASWSTSNYQPGEWRRGS